MTSKVGDGDQAVVHQWAGGVSFKFLVTIMSSTLKWEDSITAIMKKANQRLFFLRQLKKCGVACKGMLQFYRATFESVLTFSVTVWYGNYCPAEDATR